MEKISVKIQNGTVISVEKGSIFSKPSDPVIAFTVHTHGTPVKAIVKGALAKTLWQNFLAEGGTKETTIATYSGTITKQPTISFTGNIKDFRKEGLVLEDISNVEFDYKYTLV